MERSDSAAKEKIQRHVGFSYKTRSKFLTLGWSTWEGTSKVEKLRSLLLSTLLFEFHRNFSDIDVSSGSQRAGTPQKPKETSPPPPLLSLELFEYFKERKGGGTEKGLGNNDINRREWGERVATMKTSKWVEKQNLRNGGSSGHREKDRERGVGGVMAGFILDLHDPGLLHPPPPPQLRAYFIRTSCWKFTTDHHRSSTRTWIGPRTCERGRKGEDQLLGR